MSPEPALLDGACETGAELVRRAAALEKTAVDELDVNAAVLRGLDRIRDLHQLARGYGGINEAARPDEFHWLR